MIHRARHGYANVKNFARDKDERAPLVRVERHSKYFGKGETQVVALQDVSLDLFSRQVIGPSGFGKTTLLNCIGCIVEPSNGRITLDRGATTVTGRDRICTTSGCTITSTIFSGAIACPGKCDQGFWLRDCALFFGPYDKQLYGR